MDELFNPANPLTYRPHDPFLDKALLRYLHLGVISRDMSMYAARLLRSRARLHRIHPIKPTFSKRYSPKQRGWLTIPPIEYMLDLIRVIHDATGHPGARTMANHLSRHLTWVGLHQDCDKFYYQSCDHYQRHVDISAPSREPHPFDLNGPFEHVLTDST